ncbi:MAG TPA: thiazole biosynthesis protein [candidate division WOR-3 bacterium]|uniref:Thiamine thiazole synthase n=1 Tax=candidate division WOR-3 bacterium TaxID=2052148 RepID=A0A9C9ELQ4_UNCW3|nr:thiazole biosynthesis protein [candidate division WOR-3 bacterium]
MIEETIITRAIIETYTKELLDSVEADVIIGGAGPSGLCAGYYLAKKGIKTLLFERGLKPGGGMPGGGIMFNRIVVQDQGRAVLDEFGIVYHEYEKGYYVANSLEATACLTDKALKAGLRIFNLVSIEDVIVRNDGVCGVVINWSSVEMAKLHIDPVSFKAKIVIDATGHPCEITHIVEKKSGGKLLTSSGKIEGEKSMWADLAEQLTLKNTKEAYPNLYVCGMAANAVFGGPRMGPIFGGMLLSGKKVAEIIIERLQ